MQYTDSYNENIVSFVNNVKTIDGGTHEVGFKTALTRVFNDYAKSNNLFKGNNTFEGSKYSHRSGDYQIYNDYFS